MSNHHPLENFAFSFRNLKCFGEAGSGEIHFGPVTIIIGRNNVGKSSIIDAIDAFSSTDVANNVKRISRERASGHIVFTAAPSEEQLKSRFQENTTGGYIQGNHWAYARKSILGKEFLWLLNDRNNPGILNTDEPQHGLNSHTLNMLSGCVPSPFKDISVIRISAERDIGPEESSTDRKVSANGSGLTNLVRAFINSESLPRAAVEIDLLKDLNEIYLGDAHFAAITCQEDEASKRWEIFLREDLKGDVRLSQSGSSLKTVFIVLVFLRLIRKLPKYAVGKKTVFCVEEPENNLHPALLRRLLDYLLRARSEFGFSLIISTHSPICIDWASRLDGGSIVHVTQTDGVSKCSNVLEHTEKTNILDDLDVRGSDLLQSNGIIWVEGPSDRIYLRKWISLVSKDKLHEGTHFTFMYYGGRLLSHFETLPSEAMSNRISLITVNRNVAVIIDSDRKSSAYVGKARQRKPTMRLNETKRRIMDEVSECGGFCWVTEGKEIENYTPDSVLSELAGSSIFIKDIYTEIPGLMELKAKYSSKIDLANAVTSKFTTEHIDHNEDLARKLDGLCNVIRRWNSMPAL